MVKSRTNESNLHSGTQPPDRSLGVWVPLALVLLGAVVALQFEPARTRPLDMQIATRSSVVVAAKRVVSPRPSMGAVSRSTSIRVNVTPGGDDSFQLAVAGEYSIRAVDSMRELSQGNGLSNSRVESTKNGLKIGRSTFATTQLEVIPKIEPAIRVNGHLYRGIVRLFRGEATDDVLGGDEAQSKLREVFGNDVAYRDVPGLCKAATVSEIEGQGWSLNAGRYVGVMENDEVGDGSFGETYATLLAEFNVLCDNARRLEDQIREHQILIESKP